MEIGGTVLEVGDRRQLKFGCLLSLLAATIVMSACGGGSSDGNNPPPPSSITISSLSPLVLMQGASGFTLTVNGSGFTSSSQVLFNASAKSTTFVSAQQLTATIAAADVGSPGKLPVTVRDGSVTSASSTFYVVPPIMAQEVAATGGFDTTGVNILVATVANPTLGLFAVGSCGTTTCEARNTGTELKQGQTVTFFVAGQGIKAGTFYLITGDPADITITQPLGVDFDTADDGTPVAFVEMVISPTAELGPRNVIVLNADGEMSVMPGGLLITQ